MDFVFCHAQPKRNVMGKVGCQGQYKRVDANAARRCTRNKTHRSDIHNPAIDRVFMLVEEREEERVVDGSGAHCLRRHQVQHKENLQLVVKRQSRRRSEETDRNEKRRHRVQVRECCIPSAPHTPA
jgi:hypothetical protein